MYKAGDFTNGKMNEIFKKSFRDAERGCFGGSVKVSHKQLGVFHLVSDSGLKLPVLTMLRDVDGFFSYVNTVMAGHSKGLENDDPSVVVEQSKFIMSMSADDLLSMVSSFFSESAGGNSIWEFEDLCSLLVYLVCEKDLTYSSTECQPLADCDLK